MCNNKTLKFNIFDNSHCSPAEEPEGLVKITYGMMLAPFLKEWEIQIRKKI